LNILFLNTLNYRFKFQDAECSGPWFKAAISSREKMEDGGSAT